MSLNFVPKMLPLSFVRRDAFTFTLSVTFSDASALETATLRIKESGSDTVLKAIAGAVSGNDAAFTVSESDTELPADASYVYDIRVTSSTTTRTTHRGPVTVIEDAA